MRRRLTIGSPVRLNGQEATFKGVCFGDAGIEVLLEIAVAPTDVRPAPETAPMPELRKRVREMEAAPPNGY